MGSALLGRAFVVTTAENAAIGAAGGAAGPLAAHRGELLTDIPWDLVGSGTVTGAVLGFLYSVITLLRKNGVASLSPDVVAKPLVGHGWNPLDDD